MFTYVHALGITGIINITFSQNNKPMKKLISTLILLFYILVICWAMTSCDASERTKTVAVRCVEHKKIFDIRVHVLYKVGDIITTQECTHVYAYTCKCIIIEDTKQIKKD